MLGKSGVNVMINGRITYMPATALIQYLNGMSADNAKAVELITTPPAKFDAEVDFFGGPFANSLIYRFKTYVSLIKNYLKF